MLFLENEISSEYSSLQFWNDNSSSVPKQSETAQMAFFLAFFWCCRSVSVLINSLILGWGSYQHLNIMLKPLLCYSNEQN